MSKPAAPTARFKINTRFSKSEAHTLRSCQLAAAIIVPRGNPETLTRAPDAAIWPAATIIRAGLLLFAEETQGALRGGESLRLQRALRGAS